MLDAIEATGGYQGLGAHAVDAWAPIYLDCPIRVECGTRWTVALAPCSTVTSREMDKERAKRANAEHGAKKRAAKKAAKGVEER